MYACRSAAVDMIKPGRRHALEVMAFVAMPSLPSIAVPEGTVITPIAIVKGTVIAVVIAIIVIRTPSGNTYAYSVRPSTSSDSKQQDYSEENIAHGHLISGEINSHLEQLFPRAIGILEKVSVLS